MGSEELGSMNRKISKILLNCTLCIVHCVLISCASLIEKTGQFLDGSIEKTTELYKSEQNIEISKVINRSKEESILISFTEFPTIKIRGSIPSEDGIIYFTSLEYLAGNTQGWNEYSLDLFGSAKFSSDEQIVFSIIENIEKVQISKGRIQLRDTRITGDEAVTALRNRHERILALAKWMHSYSEQQIEEQQITSIDNFNNYWKKILFPELEVKRDRPAQWHQQDDIFVRAESIRWNTGYTDRTFSEELRPIRDSETMLRDWEEALPWIYIEYEWENIIQLLSNPVIFQRIK